MQLDLTQVAWSRAGAYFALSLRDTNSADPWQQRPGSALYLRTVHGDTETDRVFRLELLRRTGGDAWEPSEFTVDASPGQVRLTDGTGRVDLCFSGLRALRLRGEGGAGLRLTLVHPGAYGNAQPFDTENRWLVNAWPNRMTWLLSPRQGQMIVTAPAATLRAAGVSADLLPQQSGADWEDRFESVVEEFLVYRKPELPQSSFDDDAEAVQREFEAFRAGFPPVPADAALTADLMAYVQWSSLVAPQGYLKRPAMLMSKNHMANVWSWDHCFNALALMPHAPALAWDQFCLPFDHQDEAGALPDAVNDRSLNRSFTKPPIHGWTLRGLLEADRTGYLTDARLEEIYAPLGAWTRWWTTARDQDGDGMPQYNHGNDSGWDNATSFDVGFPLEGPELAAYLVLQMDTLALVAGRLGRAADAARWSAEADTLLERLMAHSWRGDRFVAPHSGDHATVPESAGDSLFPFLPLVLGDRLPAQARRPLIDGLLRPGRFLTPYGLATESVSSPSYERDGYWRGPIWAPPMMLIADGLRRMGEAGAAQDIAARFCRAVIQSGAAENFNAETGAGLRDRAYTWTASVFLVLARDYI